MKSTDLSSLFAPSPAGVAQTAAFRQGVVLSFDTSSGANTVSVGASTLTNLPVLATGAEIEKVAGDVVLIAILGNTYLILGRIASYGGTAFASAAQSTLSVANQVTGVGVTTGGSTIVQATMTVPSWANRASVILVCTANCWNTGAPGGNAALNAQVKIDGASFTPAFEQIVPNATSMFNMTIEDAQVVTVTPGGTMNGSLFVSSSANQTATAGNIFTARMLAIFRRV